MATFEEVVGRHIVTRAEHVEDMARRVVGVVGRNSGDHAYASNKLGSAAGDVIEVLALTDWRRDDVDKLVHRIDLDAAFAEVHRAAMDKMRAGLRRADGKILKPPGFVPPDMTGALL